MNFKKIILVPILVILIIYSCPAQKIPSVAIKDLKVLTGCWQGSLTYLDYTSNKPFTMSANLVIKQMGRSNKFIFSNIYPKEPNANSSDTIMISKDGRKINDETVRSIQRKNDGNLEIITEVSGIDGNDNKPATLRYTYTIGKQLYIHRKDVQFTGQTDFIKRHEYTYSAMKCK